MQCKKVESGGTHKTCLIEKQKKLKNGETEKEMMGVDEGGRVEGWLEKKNGVWCQKWGNGREEEMAAGRRNKGLKWNNQIRGKRVL